MTKPAWKLEDINLGRECYERGKIKRRVAIALLVEALKSAPPPPPGLSWGQVLADAACYGSVTDVASAAYEGRKVMICAGIVPIRE